MLSQFTLMYGIIRDIKFLSCNRSITARYWAYRFALLTIALRRLLGATAMASARPSWVRAGALPAVSHVLVAHEVKSIDRPRTMAASNEPTETKKEPPIDQWSHREKDLFAPSNEDLFMCKGPPKQRAAMAMRPQKLSVLCEQGRFVTSFTQISEVRT
jgi:hypothetical protein